MHIYIYIYIYTLFPRNKYRIVFTKNPICLKSYFIIHNKCYYKLHLH